MTGNKETQLPTRAVRTRASDKSEESNIDGTEWKPIYTNENVKREQLKDTVLMTVYEWVENGQRLDIQAIGIMSPAIRHYWHIFHQLKISNGVLIKQAYDNESSQLVYFQILALKSLQAEILKQAHDAPLGGHFGRKKNHKIKLKEDSIGLA